ncbi:MAG: hypothetical protein PHP52_12320 [Bacteroidales bacterium]|nr:hypothetical protein [Bacteroidales bacterium]MDD4217409.1 hypothetical protein [Bacteroidales bacterium]MDY0142677.1 hypothetical protein [Bacteroidales bacterium]
MKKTLFAVMCLLLPFAVFSQFFIETEIGYALSTDKKKLDNVDVILVDDRINNVYDVEIIPIKFSIIQSPFAVISGGYRLKKWEMSLGFSYCDNKTIVGFNRNNSYSINQSLIWGSDGDDRIFTTKSIEDFNYYTKGYYLIPEISYSFTIKHLKIKPLLGVSFRALSIYETVTKKATTYVLDSPEEKSPNYVTLCYKYKSSFSNDFSNMFALRVGLQIAYNINNNLDLFCKINSSLGNSYKVVEKVQTLYEKEFMGNVIESDNNEYVYVTNQYFDTNSLNFSFGVRYYFNNKSTYSNNE